MARLSALALLVSTLLLCSAKASQFVMYTPGNDDTSIERIDPLLNPGTFSGHVHQFFGADGLHPNITYESLQKSRCTTVGNAAGQGVAADLSSYWHPALYMESNQGGGYIRIPTNGHKMYYRDVGNDADQKREPFEFPRDFGMVAGHKHLRVPAETEQEQAITQWICHDSSGNVNGEKGGFPTGVTDCQSFPFLTGTVHFPHCWNGNDTDSANPEAHMSYPEGDVQAGPCPSSHPIRLPHIFQEHFFHLHTVADQVKPNSFVLSNGDSTGYGLHADFFNGWRDGAIPQLLKCPQPYYGNADVGVCPGFEPHSVATSDCKLPSFYKENVDSPESALPGCNPIVMTNPAPSLAIAAIGVTGNNCDDAATGPSPIVLPLPADTDDYSRDDDVASAAAAAPGAYPHGDEHDDAAPPADVKPVPAHSPVDCVTRTEYVTIHARNNFARAHLHRRRTNHL